MTQKNYQKEKKRGKTHFQIAFQNARVLVAI
jgi:hypothetical protein